MVGTIAVLTISRSAGLQADTGSALWRTLAVLVPLAVAVVLVRRFDAGNGRGAAPQV